MIGSGSFGNVYKICKDDPDLGIQTVSALKIVKVLQDSSEIFELRERSMALMTSLKKYAAANPLSRSEDIKLGTMLYQYLNHNRLPYEPFYPQPLSPSDAFRVRSKRLNNEPVPLPDDPSDLLRPEDSEPNATIAVMGYNMWAEEKNEPEEGGKEKSGREVRTEVSSSDAIERKTP